MSNKRNSRRQHVSRLDTVDDTQLGINHIVIRDSYQAWLQILKNISRLYKRRTKKKSTEVTSVLCHFLMSDYLKETYQRRKDMLIALKREELEDDLSEARVRLLKILKETLEFNLQGADDIRKIDRVIMEALVFVNYVVVVRPLGYFFETSKGTKFDPLLHQVRNPPHEGLAKETQLIIEIGLYPGYIVGDSVFVKAGVIGRRVEKEEFDGLPPQEIEHIKELAKDFYKEEQKEDDDEQSAGDRGHQKLTRSNTSSDLDDADLSSLSEGDEEEESDDEEEEEEEEYKLSSDSEMEESDEDEADIDEDVKEQAANYIEKEDTSNLSDGDLHHLKRVSTRGFKIDKMLNKLENEGMEKNLLKKQFEKARQQEKEKEEKRKKREEYFRIMKEEKQKRKENEKKKKEAEKEKQKIQEEKKRNRLSNQPYKFNTVVLIRKEAEEDVEWDLGDEEEPSSSLVLKDEMIEDELPPKKKKLSKKEKKRIKKKKKKTWAEMSKKRKKSWKEMKNRIIGYIPNFEAIEENSSKQENDDDEENNEEEEEESDQRKEEKELFSILEQYKQQELEQQINALNNVLLPILHKITQKKFDDKQKEMKLKHEVPPNLDVLMKNLDSKKKLNVYVFRACELQYDFFLLSKVFQDRKAKLEKMEKIFKNFKKGMRKFEKKVENSINSIDPEDKKDVSLLKKVKTFSEGKRFSRKKYKHLKGNFKKEDREKKLKKKRRIQKRLIENLDDFQDLCKDFVGNEEFKIEKYIEKIKLLSTFLEV